MPKPFLLTVQLSTAYGGDRLRKDITSLVETVWSASDNDQPSVFFDVTQASGTPDVFDVQFGFATEDARTDFEQRIIAELARSYRILLVNYSTSETGDRQPEAVATTVAVNSESRSPVQPFASFEDLMSAHAELLSNEIEQKASVAPDALQNVTQFIRRGTAAGTLLDNPEQRRIAQSLLNYWVTVLYRAGETNPPEPILAYHAPLPDPTLDSATCPYIGLRAFQGEDHDRFFGRERIIADMVARLKEKSVLVLVGPPGSGKSSLLNAGVIPRLKEDPVAQAWTFFPTFTPGSDPLNSLASLFGEPEPIVRKLLDKPGHLLDLLNDPNWGDTPRMLVVDQFEEVFTLCKDDQRRETFLASLLSINQSSIKHRLLLSMRSDQLNQIIRRPVLNDIYREAEIRIYPPKEGELQEIIEKPARSIGLKYEPGVADQIIREIYGDPSGLPLLQFALFVLWNDREGSTITWGSMNRLGSCREALIRKADQFYESLVPNEKEEARRVLLRMVKLSDTWEAATEPVSRKDLFAGETNRPVVNIILNKLLAANLARISNADGSPKSDADTGPATTVEGSPDDQIELVHGTLARSWPRILEWLRDLRESMVTRQRLKLFAANWGILGRGEKGLLDKYQLHEAQRWLASAEAAELGYDSDLVALVARSEKAITRARWKQRALVFSSLAFLIVALVVILVSYILQHGRLKSATSTRLAIQAREKLSGQLDLALLLGKAAYGKDNQNSEARASLMKALTENPKLRAYLHTEQGKIEQVVFSEGGARLSVRSANGSARLWNTGSHRPSGPLLKPQNQTDVLSESSARCSLLSRDGRWLMSIEDQGALVMRRLEDPSDVRKLPNANIECFEGFQLSVSNDNKFVAWLTLVPERFAHGATLSVWNTEKAEPTISHQVYALGTVAFSPDNQTLAVTNLSNDIVLLRSDTLVQVGRPFRRASSTRSSARVQFDDDGDRLASIKPNGEIGVWDVSRRRELQHLKIEDSEVEASPPQQVTPPSEFVLSSRGDKVAALFQGVMVVFDLETKEQYRYRASQEGNEIFSIVFSPDETRAVTIAKDEPPILWQIPSTELERVISGPYSRGMTLTSGRTAAISSGTFSTDSKLVAGACHDGTVVLWDLEQNLIGDTLKAEKVLDFQVLPDGKLLSLNQSNEISSFNMLTEVTTRQFSIGLDPSVRLEQTVFSNNGRVVIASYSGSNESDNRVIVWNPQNGTQDFVIPTSTNTNEPSLIATDAAGARLALAIGKQEIQLINLLNHSRQPLQPAPKDQVVSSTFSANARLLAVSDNGGNITVWDTQTKKPPQTFSDDSFSPNSSVKFTRDGSKLVSLSSDHVLRVWRLGDEPGLLSKTATRMVDFAVRPDKQVSPDKKTLSVAGLNEDGSIVFWDLDNSREQFEFAADDLASLTGGVKVSALAFTEDGNALVTRDLKGKLILLKVDLPSWISRVCRIANRPLTFMEWNTNRVFEDQLMSWLGFRKFLYDRSSPTCP